MKNRAHNNKMRITESQLKSIIKEETAFVLMNEAVFDKVTQWIKKKGEGAKDAAIDFFQKLKQEFGETKEGAKILYKMSMGDKLTPEEEAALKEQIKDLAIGIPLLALVAAPGGGVATVALVKVAKKFGIDLMPSAFKEKSPAHAGLSSDMGGGQLAYAKG